MAEEIKKYENLRRTKLTAFTRKQNQVQNLVNSGADADDLNEALDELKKVYELVVSAHDDYVALVEEEVLDAEGDYLEVPSNSVETVKIAVNPT